MLNFLYISCVTLILALLIAGCGVADDNWSYDPSGSKAEVTPGHQGQFVCDTAKLIDEKLPSNNSTENWMVLESPEAELNEEKMFSDISNIAWSMAKFFFISLDKGAKLWEKDQLEDEVIEEALDTVVGTWLMLLIQEQMDLPGLRVRPTAWEVLPTPHELLDEMTQEGAMEMFQDEYESIAWRGLLQEERAGDLLTCSLDASGMWVEPDPDCIERLADLKEAAIYFGAVIRELQQQRVISKVIKTGLYAGQDLAVIVLTGKLLQLVNKAFVMMSNANVVGAQRLVWMQATERKINPFDPLVVKYLRGLYTMARVGPKGSGSMGLVTNHWFAEAELALKYFRGNAELVEIISEAVYQIARGSVPVVSTIETTIHLTGLTSLLMAANHIDPTLSPEDRNEAIGNLDVLAAEQISIALESCAQRE